MLPQPPLPMILRHRSKRYVIHCRSTYGTGDGVSEREVTCSVGNQLSEPTMARRSLHRCLTGLDEHNEAHGLGDETLDRLCHISLALLRVHSAAYALLVPLVCPLVRGHASGADCDEQVTASLDGCERIRETWVRYGLGRRNKHETTRGAAPSPNPKSFRA
eukprot:4966823-Prymnesium_polylepis.1